MPACHHPVSEPGTTEPTSRMLPPKIKPGGHSSTTAALSPRAGQGPGQGRAQQGSKHGVVGQQGHHGATHMVMARPDRAKMIPWQVRRITSQELVPHPPEPQGSAKVLLVRSSTSQSKQPLLALLHMLAAMAHPRYLVLPASNPLPTTTTRPHTHTRRTHRPGTSAAAAIQPEPSPSQL